MSINGLLVKIIVDKNPGREFFIEESFPLDWMYPYLEPHGLIFKLNREPLAELSGETVQQDREYWQPRVKQMIGGWLNDKTSVKDVTAFAEKVFLRHDLGGFTGDPRFVQNDYATRMFSKLRASIAGHYLWHMKHAANKEDKERMTRAADFAFRQAWALCPYSPEGTYPYVNCLLEQKRVDDALLVAETTAKMPELTGESRTQIRAMVEQITEYRKSDLMAVSMSVPAKAPVFQMRLVVDAPADDAEKMIMLSTNQASGQVRQDEVYVQKPALLDQTALQSAKLINNSRGEPQIEITFTGAGRKQFAKVTREHLHQRLAIVIDGKLLSAPTIQTEINTGTGEIAGSFSEAEAKALTAKINEAVGR